MQRRGVAFGLSLVLANASSEAATGEYWIDWSQDSACGSAAQFREEVSARAAQFRHSEGGTRVAVEVERDGRGYHWGRLVLPDGTRRTVRAVSCADVVPALAFVLVVALDTERADLSTPSPPNVDEAAPRHWLQYVGATGGVEGGRVPQELPVAGLFLEWWRPGRTFWAGARLRVLFGAGRMASAPDDVRMRLGSAGVDLCPVSVSFVSLCAGLELGAAHLQSGAGLSNLGTWRVSSTGRAGGQMRLVVNHAMLLELGLGASLPMTRDEFVIQRRDGTVREIHESTIGAYVLAAIGVRL